jgi:uncharacterized SAM-binding protein YcdF (DUF218 family)
MPHRSSRALRYVLGIAVAAAGLWWARAPLLRTAGEFLVVDDTLQPASAIIVLDGGQPFREREAARLYERGWAPRIVITRGPAGANRAQILEQLGVPSAAIEVVDQQPSGTLEELELLKEAVGNSDSPVLLVTSPYHTRRTELDWSRAADGEVPGIVRPARQDTFDTHGWWRDPQTRLRVWHEYLGLAATLVGLRDS